MKIALFVNNIDQIGGAEIATRRLAERLALRGHEVTLISTQSIRQHVLLFDYTKQLRVIRLPIWQRSHRTFAQLLTLQALWTFPFLLCGAQILHLRGLTPETIILARIAQKLGVKTLCVPMSSGVYGDVALFPADVPHNFRAFDWISALTEPLRAEVIDWGFPVDRIGIIPNGVDLHLFTPPPAICDDPHVIFVGQFRPEKQVDLLLRAWQQVQQDFPCVQLTLVGGGQNLPKYQQIASELGGNPTFIPNTNETGVLDHLRASSIFVLPGISEGMSNALLEAMAVGLAPIVSDTPANRAVITPEINGLSYQAGSADALAAQLNRLITDNSLRQKIGAAARHTVEQCFDLDHVTDAYLDLYRRLLDC